MSLPGACFRDDSPERDCLFVGFRRKEYAQGTILGVGDFGAELSKVGRVKFGWPRLAASGHSKTVKRAVATTALLSALKKSCPHQMATSFERQASRLQNAGYPKSLLKPVCETLLQRIKAKEKRRPPQPTEEDRRRLAVLPYVHGFSHAMKKVGKKHGIKVVFSAPNKAYGMCRQVNRCVQQEQKEGLVFGFHVWVLVLTGAHKLQVFIEPT
ncbi:hypothetical protein HPB48_017171 [Haemaphysalis longicornis]|uniref:Uncharacterized protein n=1 Tax=Haemaphysalis longicornis TaxID=44386 RepID=A0A9J6GLI4_HAELO|nr:hypothetical protein HPB48_017171 [Haemaphysalis longicornis]